jgi:membrane-bound metal-dependent hydrolase YbcI (DUF457 family)
VGPSRQRQEEEGFGTDSGRKVSGPWAVLWLRLKSVPVAFLLFLLFLFFFFWFYLKALQMKPYLIQTNFELCKIQISPYCLSIGKDFVSEKVKTFGTQMHMMINMDACA